ncbi:hypothetical protein [Novosphingobium sp. M1R2S20]|uniref:Maltogenic amylase-like enzyme n=1 Tax=Novosphingobium rhizovicinum TaxID=3228928 RepID=A0ABV3R763_9SPHN
MQWSNGVNGGFTHSDKPIRPSIDRGPYAFGEVNVATQRASSDSLLNWTERALRLRREVPEIGRGIWTVLDTPESILALRFNWESETSVIVHNFAGEATDCTLPYFSDDGDARELVCLQTNERLITGPRDAKAFVLQPYGYRWFRLGGLDEFVHSHAERH